MNPIDTLPQLIVKLSSFHAVNCGGCGVVAAHVAKRLQYIVPTRVVVFNTNTKIKIDEIRPKLKNSRSVSEWSSHGMRWDHVMVEFEYQGSTFLFDSEGVFPASNTITLQGSRMIKSGYVTIEEISAIAANPRNWNSWFNRQQIPKMRGRIHRFFQKHIPVEV